MPRRRVAHHTHDECRRLHHARRCAISVAFHPQPSRNADLRQLRRVKRRGVIDAIEMQSVVDAATDKRRAAKNCSRAVVAGRIGGCLKARPLREAPVRHQSAGDRQVWVDDHSQFIEALVLPVEGG